MDATNNSATNDRPCAAISLLDKYAALNKNIEITRNKLSASQSRLEDVRQEIYNLANVERKKMKDDIRRAESEIEKMKSLKIEEQGKLKNMEVLYRKVLRDKDVANKDLLDTRRNESEKRKGFIESCKNFRIECLQMRMNDRAGRNGIENKFGCHYDSSSSDDCDDDCVTDNEDEIDQDNFKSKEEGPKSLFPNVLIEIEIPHPFGGILDGKRKRSSKKKNFDEELHLAKKKRKIALEAKTESKRGLYDARNDLENALKRTDDRAHKLARGRSQLDRIRKVVEDMETEMKRLEQETSEARSLGEAFAKDVSRRRRNGDNGFNHNASFNNNTYNNGDQYSGNNTTHGRNNNHASLSTTPAEYTSYPNYPTTPYANSYNNSSHQQHNIRQSEVTPELPTATTTASSHHRKSHPKNPYTRQKPFQQPNNTYQRGPTLIRDDDDDDDRNKSSSRQIRRSLEHQHPHRAGTGRRIRSDRQFGTALEITSGFDETTTTGTSSSTKGMGGYTTKATTATKGSGNDGDDDDEDDLLSYVAFRKM